MWHCFWRIFDWTTPSASDPLWKACLKPIGVVWGSVTVTVGVLGYTELFGLLLLLPPIIVVTLVPKIVPPVVGVVGLADDFGLIDLPSIFTPFRMVVTFVSGFADLGWLVQFTSGSAELAGMGVKRSISLTIKGTKFVYTLFQYYR